MSQRIIAHLDMDAFFASIEEVSTPGFLGKPIVVGAEIINGKGRGVVSTANYKAREYGIHSAMPISVAFNLSQKAKKEGKPEVIFLPVDFDLYERVSESIFKIIKSYVAVIEKASIDEFYFDLSFLKTFKKAEAICLKIKEDIKKQHNITCSVGISINKLVSKIAAGINKPNAILTVKKKDVQSFLNPLSIREIPGIGPKTAQVLFLKKIETIKELNNYSEEKLGQLFGKQGLKIFKKIKGFDNDPVIESYEVKSIGEQVTFEENTKDISFLFDEFQRISFNVFNRFLKTSFISFSKITITVRFSDFETKTCSKSFKGGITDFKKFNLEVLKLMFPFLDKRNNPKGKSFRLIGVKIEKLLTCL